MSDKKRKRVVVTIEEKYNAVQRLDAGELAQDVGKSLSVGRSTVLGWKKNRQEIMNWYLCHAGPSISRIE